MKLILYSGRKHTIHKGDRFGRLVAVSQAEANKWRQSFLVFACDCGKSTRKKVMSVILGYIKSCGCIRAERLVNKNYKHGLSTLREHRNWIKMWQRCTNPRDPAYKNYGGRGITVCQEWRDFERFLNDMGRSHGLTIERVDNNKGYSKDNCVWATRKEQSRNTRRSRWLTFNGETKIMRDWALHLGLPVKLLESRITTLKWSVEKALTTPSPQRRTSC